SDVRFWFFQLGDMTISPFKFGNAATQILDLARAYGRGAVFVGKAPAAFRAIGHRPNPKERPQHMKSEQADPACGVNRIDMRMMPLFGNLRRNVVDRDDAVEYHDHHENKQTEREVVQEWIADHFGHSFKL